MRVAHRSKFGAIRTGGYASKLEARKAAELKLLERYGKIRNLAEQVVYEVQPDGCELIRWRIDFRYEEPNARYTTGYKTVCEEVKGLEQRDFVIKAKLFRWKYPEIELRIWRG